MKQSRYGLVKQLIELAEQYEAEEQPTNESLLDFTRWLNNRMTDRPAERTVNGTGADLDGTLSSAIGYLYRYAKHYSKKALKETSLTTLDDFIFLVTLQFGGHKTKSELIHEHLLEITSGMEIIKRLLKSGLVEEQDNEADRRSVLLRITHQGTLEMMKAMHQMEKAARIVGGNLDASEKMQLLGLTNKLKKFHDKIHEQDKKSPLDEILEKYY
jgi:DNA-binding MarR family transcriptional regulator